MSGPWPTAPVAWSYGWHGPHSHWDTLAHILLTHTVLLPTVLTRLNTGLDWDTLIAPHYGPLIYCISQHEGQFKSLWDAQFLFLRYKTDSSNIGGGGSFLSFWVVIPVCVCHYKMTPDCLKLICQDCNYAFEISWVVVLLPFEWLKMVSKHFTAFSLIFTPGAIPVFVWGQDNQRVIHLRDTKASPVTFV